MALANAENAEKFNLNPTGPAIGIDLGTTNSCVGYFINNNVEIILTAAGKRTVPSYVFYNGNEGCMIGEQAIARLRTNPNQVVYDSKRMIGLNYDDNVVDRNKSFWTFTIAKSDNNRPIYVLDKDNQVLPEDVSSEILKELIKMAQDKIGTEKIKSAVITVPDHFLIGQKEATIHAAKLAGIEHVKLITEPTAAAFAYGFDHKKFDGYNLFVFDLGGGTCDVSIVKVEKGEFKVIGHAGDTQLGGRDYDNHLIQHFDQKFKDLRVFEDTNNIVTTRKMRLREGCENLKIALSHPAKASETISLDDVMDGLPDETITYKDFKEIVSDLTRRCRKLCLDALEETKLEADDINEVLLVGGSSKMRVIKDMLKDVFQNKDLSEAINPDEAVAYGATLRAAQLLDPQKSQGFGIVDSLGIGIGVALAENRYHFLIKRNTPIPTKFGPETYSTVYNNQTSMSFQIYEGERLLADRNHFIMGFELEGLPKKRAEEVRATLDIELDENGILKAIARGEGKEATHEVNHNEKKATGKKIEDMFADMEINCDRDREKDRINAARTEIIKNINFIKWDCEEKKKKKPHAKELDGLLKECKDVEKWLNSNNAALKPEIREQFEKIEKDAKRLLQNS
uniref:Heat shock protein 70 n=1 Tax=Panagrolaimus sp. ES5 TaxID=591445 RepID=A0AC34F2I5_9BILA